MIGALVTAGLSIWSASQKNKQEKQAAKQAEPAPQQQAASAPAQQQADGGAQVAYLQGKLDAQREFTEKLMAANTGGAIPGNGLSMNQIG